MSKLTKFLTALFSIALVAVLVMCFGLGNAPASESKDLNTTSDLSGVVSDYSGTSENDGSTNEPRNSSPEASSEPEESTPPADSTVHFLACPDNIIHPSVYYDAIDHAAAKAGVDPVYSPLATAEYDFTHIYTDVAEHIAAAEISYINVETMIGGNANGINGYPCFNTPETMGEYLCELGYDIMNLAHNHMLDSGNDKYLKNCYNFFKERGKTVIGFYENESELDNIVVYEKNGIKIALLAYTYSTNGIVLRNSDTYIPYFDEALIRKQVAKAKEVSDVVIVSSHWGDEDNYEPNSYQRQYAQLMVDLEVDVILGMHPHVIQPMSWKVSESGHKTLLVYSLGNFISGMQDGMNMLGGMLDFDIVKDGATGKCSIENVLFTPTITHYVKPVRGLNGTDTGYRNYHIYPLSIYTEELAASHEVQNWDKRHRPSLIGGKFTRANLVATVQEFIPAEFLADEFKPQGN